jgi:thiol-disulfide isomerase/thioredoxin
MRLTLLSLVALSLLAMPLLGSAGDVDEARQEALDKLRDDFNAAMKANQQKFFNAKTKAEKDEILNSLIAIAAKAIKLADAADDDVSKSAHRWIITSLQRIPLTEKGTALLEEVVQKSKDKSTQGRAMLLMAKAITDELDNPQIKLPEAKKLTAKAIGIYERIVKDYGDINFTGKGTLGEMAAKELIVLKTLSVGAKLPDVVSTDLQGKKVKISDYRGKVVVLDIWATWCPPCRAMIPHERELVKRLEKEPFVLISVSADNDQETLEKFLEKEPMPWVHWYSGPKSKLMDDLNIRFFPTIFILDADGVIRYRNLRGKEMDEAVDTLLEELREQKK